MMDAFIGSIALFAGTFAPRGWAFCHGQLMSISENSALFAILGTTYGGNGQTTFALPDLRGRVPVQEGQGPGLPHVELGEMSGWPTTTLIAANMPAHTHKVNVVPGTAVSDKADGNFLAQQTRTGGDVADIYSPGTPGMALNPAALSTEGGNQPFNNMQPYLGLNYIICLDGIFPSRG